MVWPFRSLTDPARQHSARAFPQPPTPRCNGSILGLGLGVWSAAVVGVSPAKFLRSETRLDPNAFEVSTSGCLPRFSAKGASS